MTDDKLKNPYHWIRMLGSAMWLFQCQPTEQHRAVLMAIIRDYQLAAAQGLPVCRSVPPPLEPAANLSDYYRRELNEALIQFKVNPEDGYEVLDKLMDGYIEAVQQGRIKP